MPDTARGASPSRSPAARYDVLVIGAGVDGAGVFRDLSIQGIDCLLVDSGDFCSGASAAPSRLIHGGIRYLETGEFRLVAQVDLRAQSSAAQRPALRQAARDGPADPLLVRRDRPLGDKILRRQGEAHGSRPPRLRGRARAVRFLRPPAARDATAFAGAQGCDPARLSRHGRRHRRDRDLLRRPRHPRRASRARTRARRPRGQPEEPRRQLLRPRKSRAGRRRQARRQHHRRIVRGWRQTRSSTPAAPGSTG